MASSSSRTAAAATTAREVVAASADPPVASSSLTARATTTTTTTTTAGAPTGQGAAEPPPAPLHAPPPPAAPPVIVTNAGHHGVIIDLSSYHQDRMDIDASISPLCWLLSLPMHCGFCPYRTVLHLEKEEAVRQDVTLCGERTSHRPYGELEKVETSMFCCLTCVDSGLQTLMPGMGCFTNDYHKCKHIEHELKKRQRRRGDTAQIQLSEATLAKATEINVKLDVITKHLTSLTQEEQDLEQQQRILESHAGLMGLDDEPSAPTTDTMEDRGIEPS